MAARVKHSTPLIAKFFLVMVGLVLALTLFEVSLRLAGAWYMRVHPARIRLTAGDVSRYRIVALGESTTAYMNQIGWPELLEQELNRRVGQDMFRVYNLGVAGTNTSKLLTYFMQEGVPLAPHMVISMMGVNDQKYFSLPVIARGGTAQAASWVNQSYVYKFFTALFYIAGHRQQASLLRQAASCQGDNSLGEKDWANEYLPRYEASIEKMYPAPYNGPVSNTNEDKKAARIIVDFLTTHPFSYAAYEVLADHLASRSLWADVIALSVRTQEVLPFIRLCISANPQVSLFVKDNELRQLTDIGYHIDALGQIGQTVVRTKNNNSAQVFYEQIRQALGIGERHANIDTKKDYSELAGYLDDHRIEYVAMQYPLLPVSDLETMLAAYPKVVFVSNEKNFQDALRTQPQGEVFTDSFAGIFGHTTLYGSSLIASAAADTVLRLVAQSGLPMR